jgi:hypothetical protein
MQSLANLPSHSQVSSSLPHRIPARKHCEDADLSLDQRGQHFGSFCRGCGRWQGRWIKHSEVKRLRQSQANRPVSAARSPVFDVAPKPVTVPLQGLSQQAGLSLAPRDDSHRACLERFEKIERELTVVLKAIWACGVL